MRKYATLTNLIYVGAFIRHALVLSFCTPWLLILGIASGKYHYLRARKQAGLSVNEKELDKWQRFDVASIYLLLGMYPLQITQNEYWALFFVAGAMFAIQKIFSDVSWDSYVIIPAFALLIFVLGFIYMPWYYPASALGFMALALLANMLAEKLLHAENTDGYDKLHGEWHNYSGIAFIIIA